MASSADLILMGQSRSGVATSVSRILSPGAPIRAGSTLVIRWTTLFGFTTMTPAQVQLKIDVRSCSASPEECQTGHASMPKVICGTAVFFGGCIVRVAPDGQIDRVVEMPVQNVTTCTFGGANRRTLYITTATIQAPPDDRLAGGLFAIRTEVEGQPENCFAIFGARESPERRNR